MTSLLEHGPHPFVDARAPRPAQLTPHWTPARYIDRQAILNGNVDPTAGPTPEEARALLVSLLGQATAMTQRRLAGEGGPFRVLTEGSIDAE
jgi:hypothetical protein